MDPAQERTNTETFKSPELNPDAPRHPFIVELKVGEKISWCTCGYTKTEPFCDGAHRECTQGLRSSKYTPEASGKVALCGCKRTKNPPFCDGSHSRIQN